MVAAAYAAGLVLAMVTTGMHSGRLRARAASRAPSALLVTQRHTERRPVSAPFVTPLTEESGDGRKS